MEARVVWDHEGAGSTPAGSTVSNMKNYRLNYGLNIPVDRYW